MITSKGNQIIAKYMLGQAPEYAAYLAVGVGAQPLFIGDAQSTDTAKKSLDFEAFRVPVLSRGIVNDTINIDATYFDVYGGSFGNINTAVNHGLMAGEQFTMSFTDPSMAEYNGLTFTAMGVSDGYISFSHLDYSITDVTWNAADPDLGTVVYVRDRLVFKAQLPPDQRYEMTEVAIFPAANNQLALGYDSRSIAGFLTTEGWNYYDGSSAEISFTTTSLADDLGDVSASAIDRALFVNSNNQLFSYTERFERYETPRYLNRCLLVSGDLSYWDPGTMVTVPTSYVTTSDIPINLSKNSPNDNIKLAVSVISPSLSGTLPDETRIRLEFGDTVGGGIAYINYIIYSGDISFSRYQVITRALTDFVIEGNFSWARVNKVSVYAQTVDTGNNWDGSYVVLDGIRLDNENTLNPLYGMVAHSVLKNQYYDGQPIEKVENSQGYMEYRMGVSVY